MSPNPCMKAACIGSMTPCRLPLAAQPWNLLIPLPPPFWRNLQELLPPSRSIKSPGEGEEERLPAQPIKMQRLAKPTPWPRMSTGPMKIQHAGQWPDPAQRPMTSRRWGVPQCISIPASTPLMCHSLPFQRPMKMQDPHFACTTLNFLGLKVNLPPTFTNIYMCVCVCVCVYI